MLKIILLYFIFIYSIYPDSPLKEKINNLINKIPSSTKASIYILNANTGESIYERNINSSMIPASNTKLFTTAVGLNLMGSKHVFETKILIDDADIENGAIDGDLYIKGFGHSTFTTNDLDSLVAEIEATGIKLVTGNIIGDDTYFDDLYVRDDWIMHEKANVRLPPVSALVVNKNQFVITLRSNGSIGSKLDYSIKPACSFIDVDIKAEVTRNRTRPRIRSSQEGNKIKVTVSGGLRKRRTSRSYVVNIANPPLYLASLLKDHLQAAGIKVLGKASAGSTPIQNRAIASIGIQLDSLIALTNKNSNNYLAECLFKTIGAYYSGEQGNSFYATQAILSSFDDDFIIDDETAVVDGSGISRFNTITTGSIVRLLKYVYNNERLFNDFYHSLAISGIDGTLKDRPVNKFIKGNFHGKTGTLNGVTALSGYLTSRKNNTYIISIIMEFNSKGSRFHKNLEDQILLELAE